MYSENDFRYYQGGELFHAEEKKKWNWLPGGKNPPEYNAWYYATHPEKWGITKAAKDVYNKATTAAKNTDTDLDDKALDLIGRGANRVKEGLKNNSVVGDVRRSTEALQRRDTAERKAAQARANASRATSSRTADMYEKEAQKYDRQAAQESANARGYGNRAKNTVSRGVRNTAESVGRSARNLGQRALNATTIDDSLREAGRNLRRGNYAGAGRAVKQAGYEAGSRAVGAVRSGAEAVGRTARSLGQRALDATTIDESLREAGSNLRRGNYAGAGRAVKQAGYEAGSRAVGAVRGVGKAARDLGQRALNSTDLDERAAQLGRDAKDAVVGAAKTAGERATQLGRDAVDAVRSVPGRVSDATGLSARNRSQQARANADELNRKAAGAEKLAGDDPGPNTERFAKDQRAAAQRAERTAQNAESSYKSTPLGKAETGARKAGEAATTAAETVKGAAGKTAEEAQRLARKEVRDAMSEYWEIVDKYGANSRQAQVAAQQAESRMNSTERQLLNNFGNAKNTIEGVIDDGVKWLDEITDGRFSAYEYSWDGPLTLRTTDTRDGSYHTDNLLTGKRTYVKNFTIGGSDDDKKKK